MCSLITFHGRAYGLPGVSTFAGVAVAAGEGFLDQVRFDFLDAHRGGVQVDGVRRLGKRRIGAGAVALVALTHLRRKHHRINAHPRPPTFAELVEVGQGIAGTPATVTAFLRQQIEATGSNYVVGQFAFGDLSREESLQSIGLFAREVMPPLRAKAATGAMETAGVAARGRR